MGLRDTYRPVKYDSISFVPPKHVQENAKKGQELRDQFDSDAATPVGRARGRYIANGEHLSPRSVDRIVNYFKRHERNKYGKNFEMIIILLNGYISWLLLGGDEGREWAQGVQVQMRKADSKSSETD